jgi:hypothetical protein
MKLIKLIVITLVAFIAVKIILAIIGFATMLLWWAVPVIVLVLVVRFLVHRRQAKRGPVAKLLKSLL